MTELPFPSLRGDPRAGRVQVPLYLLTHVGIFRALTRPCFFLSTFLGSRVMQPASVIDQHLCHHT